MSVWFDLLRGLFGPTGQPEKRVKTREARPTVPQPSKPATQPAKMPPPTAEAPQPPRKEKPSTKSHVRSSSYLIIVGLDFGTAFTKCVVRDANVRDPGKAYPVLFKLAGGAAYLVPSVVVRRETGLSSAFDQPVDDGGERIDYLKMRLVSELDRQRAGAWRDDDSSGEMQAMVAWFLAQVLAGVGKEIRRHWADFGDHDADQCFINICVPVAHSDGSRVEECLLTALCAARNTVGPAGTQAPNLEQIKQNLSDATELTKTHDYCYTYPETSANLQSYLKSRARQPGLYLFADVGAGTVDLSFFQVLEDTSKDATLLYYHAAVLDAGSSRLELKAKESAPDVSLHEFIAVKEGQRTAADRRIETALTAARNFIYNEVAKGVGDGVRVTESKLHLNPRNQRNQMQKVKMMHAGGGYAQDPYGRAIQYFHRHRQWSNTPPLDPMTVPDDLVWAKNSKQIPFARLSVAYGLAFPRYNLDGHKFPSQTAVNPDSPRPRPVERPTAPTKDEV